MVSPEGESLELVEKIDPKGQNVEAWMLELEGNMRLTVRLYHTYVSVHGLYYDTQPRHTPPYHRKIAERMPFSTMVHATVI